MQTDYIIAGQGICGTLLTRALMKEGKRIIVIDEATPYSSGEVASGLINPVTGMRVAKSWIIDELLPAADKMYEEIQQGLGIKFTTRYELLEFHTTAESRALYEERISQQPAYLHHCSDEKKWDALLNFHYGISAISGCSVVDMRRLQSAFRKMLQTSGALLEERFDHQQLQISGSGVAYKDIEAEKIIFCEGAAGLHNPFFSLLPFALTKGEVIIASIPDLPRTHVLKHGLKIVPWEDDLFWIGSSFDWKYADIKPTEAFMLKAEMLLKQWLKVPYTIKHHWASERPGTVDHKPFVGFHPLHPAVGIFNGMGAKGCSQAPYFAGVMVDHLVNGALLHPEADIKRYTRILSRGV